MEGHFKTINRCVHLQTGLSDITTFKIDFAQAPRKQEQELEKSQINNLSSFPWLNPENIV